MEDSSQPWASRVASLTRALEAAGIEFIDENGGGPGMRLECIRYCLVDTM
jgi:hypothetical protein